MGAEQCDGFSDVELRHGIGVESEHYKSRWPVDDVDVVDRVRPAVPWLWQQARRAWGIRHRMLATRCDGQAVEGSSSGQISSARGDAKSSDIEAGSVLAIHWAFG